MANPSEWVRTGRIPRSKVRRFDNDPLFDEKREAEIPVPARLTSKKRAKELVQKLKFSQKIGLLLVLHRLERLTPGGQLQLLRLQQRASFEALRSGLNFCERVLGDQKLQQDFVHELIELNRRPRQKPLFRAEVRQVGVGYRDKGTLPSSSSGARKAAGTAGYLFFEDLESSDLKLWITLFHSSCLSEDGLWLDIQELATVLKRERRTEDFRPLFHPL